MQDPSVWDDVEEQKKFEKQLASSQKPEPEPVFDFGFKFQGVNDLPVQETKDTACEDKLTKLYEMIMGLLNNLKADPAKDHIYWPNRQQKVDEFIKKVNEVVMS